MEVIKTPLRDCFIIKSKVFGDNRGFFLESFNQLKFNEAGIDFDVKQINFAKSGSNVLRGLHFQKSPFAQSKLVGVICGAVIDIAVDLRRSSPTFKQHFMLEISSPDTFLLVPRGFAHGYYTLKEETVFYYAVDNFYSADAESGILYNDPELAIDWGIIASPTVSAKDQNQPLLSSGYIFE